VSVAYMLQNRIFGLSEKEKIAFIPHVPNRMWYFVFGIWYFAFHTIYNIRNTIYGSMKENFTPRSL